jgi:hypothetical protein
MNAGDVSRFDVSPVVKLPMSRKHRYWHIELCIFGNKLHFVIVKRHRYTHSVRDQTPPAKCFHAAAVGDASASSLRRN